MAQRCRAVIERAPARAATGFIVLFATLVLTGVRVIGAQAICPQERPAYQTLRYEEDYRFLHDPACRTDWWDRFKYVPLTPTGDWYLSSGGSVRLKYEYFRNNLWGQGPQDPNGFFLQRYLLHGDLQAPFGRLFVELGSALEDGRDGGPRPTDEDRLDVNQLFLDIRAPLSEVGTLTLRAGRQELAYGSQRLVSVREGPNVRQTFDAVRLVLDAGAWRADGFASRPVETKPGVFDDTRDAGRAFWGVYAVGPSVGPRQGIDVYYLGLDREDASFDQGTADEERHTVGVRLWGRPGEADYNLELVYQFGRFGRGDIQAWAATLDAGYTLASVSGRPRFGLKTEINSGDRDPNDPDLETLNGLFPKGNYFGEIGLLGPANILDVHPSLDVALPWGLRLTLDWTVFWRQSLRDGIYSPAGGLLRSGRQSRARFVGHQPGVKLEWQIDRHLSVVVVYNRFFAGDFIRETGADKDIDYVGGWVSYRF